MHLPTVNPAKRTGNIFPSKFDVLWVRLIVGTPIFPGQTIVFRWETERLDFGPLNVGAASISLQLVDDLGALDPTGCSSRARYPTAI